MNCSSSPCRIRLPPSADTSIESSSPWCSMSAHAVAVSNSTSRPVTRTEVPPVPTARLTSPSPTSGLPAATDDMFRTHAPAVRARQATVSARKGRQQGASQVLQSCPACGVWGFNLCAVVGVTAARNSQVHVAERRAIPVWFVPWCSMSRSSLGRIVREAEGCDLQVRHASFRPGTRLWILDCTLVW